MGSFFESKKTSNSSFQNQFDPTGMGLYRTGAGNYEDFLRSMGSYTGATGTSPLLAAFQSQLVPSAGEKALPGAYSKALDILPGIQSSIQNVLADSASGLNTDAVINPLARAFQQVIAPEIRSSAIRAGAPGGSRELELFNRAYGQFGQQAADALGQLELDRRKQATTAAAVLPGSAVQTALAGVMPTQAEAEFGQLARALGMQNTALPMTLLQGYAGFTPISPLQTGGTAYNVSRERGSPYQILTGILNDFAQAGNYLGTAGGALGGPTTPFSSNISGTPNQGIPPSGWGGSMMNNAMLLALMGGGGGGMMSDRRLKKDIKHIGDLNGIKLYTYKLFGKQSIGVMADEVAKVKPEAVFEVANGFLGVNYAML